MCPREKVNCSSARDADVSIGFAAGEWQTVEEWKGQTKNAPGFQWNEGAASIRNANGVMLSWPKKKDDAVEVTLAHLYVNEQTRLVVVKDDNLVEGRRAGLGSGDGIAGGVYTFPNLSLEDEFSLAFQKRPYTWLTFRDVSVRPGHRTKPRVSVDVPNDEDSKRSSLPLQEGDVDQIRTAILGSSPSTRTGVTGKTSFFDIADAGSRILYVIDRSGSMSDHGAFRITQSELVASIKALDDTQQFQVIFYGQNATALVPTDTRSEMFRGTAAHVSEARRQIQAVVPDGGTQHLKPLERALAMTPDVIFFVTDASQPVLTVDQMDRIRRSNDGGARIHCIELGEGRNLPSRRDSRSFLQRLAEENGGQYRYNDVRTVVSERSDDGHTS